MKNVCFVNTTGFWGGGEKLHLEYALKFRARGLNVFLVVKPGGSLHNVADRESFSCFGLKTGNLSFLNIFKINKLAQYFTLKNIDTVIYSSSPDFKLGSLAARKAGVTNIVYLRGMAVPVIKSIINKYI